ncbi:MAG: sensor histidine kinase, partial [Spirochaetales bacterium]|nr:sensor histidine kinase [Spirochaetales bacterium]
SSVVAGPYAGFGIGLVSGPFTILYLHFLKAGTDYSLLYVFGHSGVMSLTGMLTGSLHRVVQRLRNELRNREEIERILIWKEKENAELAKHKNMLLEQIYERIMEHYAFLDSIISLSKETHAENPETRKVLTDMQSRISALAETQRFIFDNGCENVELEELINLIAHTIIYEFSTTELVSIRTNVCKAAVPGATASNLALVLNELLINTIQYSLNTEAPTVIEIRCTRKDNGSIEFFYTDDGPGFPESVLYRRRSGTGMLFIEEIVNHILGGHLEITNADGAVVRFCLEVND